MVQNEPAGEYNTVFLKRNRFIDIQIILRRLPENYKKPPVKSMFLVVS